MERLRSIIKRVDLVGWIVPAVVVLVWLWLSASGQIPAYKLPSPVALLMLIDVEMQALDPNMDIIVVGAKSSL